MKIIVIAERHLLMADAVPTPEVLHKIIGGLPETLSVKGPGHVRGHWNNSRALMGEPPNVLATLFHRRNGSIGDREVVVGTVALTGGDGVGGYADCPDWVLDRLEALLPEARAINGLASARAN